MPRHKIGKSIYRKKERRIMKKDFTKMKGRKALVLALIVGMISLFASGLTAFAGTSGQKKVKEIAKHSGTDNSETVYVFQKNDGTSYKRIVSENEQIHETGYEDATLPVNMKVEYTLYGKEISAKDIAGKSGHVTIHVSTSKNIRSNGVYVPFVVITGFMLDDEEFSNVSISGGKLFDDGTKNVVMGFTCPGLAESLGIGGASLPIGDSFTIEADTSDFNIDNVYSVVSAEPFKDINLQSVNKIGDLESKLDMLKKSAVQLPEATAKLSKGAGDLSAGSAKLTAASTQLSNGTEQAKLGNIKMQSGLEELYYKKPTTEYPQGSGTLVLGMGAKDLAAGTGMLNENVKNVNIPEISLTDQQKQAIGAAAASNPQVTGIANDLSKGIAKNMSEAIKKDLQKQLTSSETKTQMTNAMTAAAMQNPKVQKLATLVGEGEVKELVGGIVSGTLDATAANMQIDSGKIEAGISPKLTEAVTGVASKSAVAGAQGAVDGINKKIKDDGYDKKLNELKAASAQINAGATKLSDGLDKVNVGLAGEDGKGEGKDNLIGASKMLAAATTKIADSMKEFSAKQAEFDKGVNQLASGAKLLDSTVTSAIDKVKTELGSLNVSGIANAVKNSRALGSAAAGYNSFGGKGSYDTVTFIYKMDEV